MNFESRYKEPFAKRKLNFDVIEHSPTSPQLQHSENITPLSLHPTQKVISSSFTNHETIPSTNSSQLTSKYNNNPTTESNLLDINGDTGKKHGKKRRRLSKNTEYVKNDSSETYTDLLMENINNSEQHKPKNEKTNSKKHITRNNDKKSVNSKKPKGKLTAAARKAQTRLISSEIGMDSDDCEVDDGRGGIPYGRRDSRDSESESESDNDSHSDENNEEDEKYGRYNDRNTTQSSLDSPSLNSLFSTQSCSLDSHSLDSYHSLDSHSIDSYHSLNSLHTEITNPSLFSDALSRESVRADSIQTHLSFSTPLPLTPEPRSRTAQSIFISPVSVSHSSRLHNRLHGTAFSPSSCTFDEPLEEGNHSKPLNSTLRPFPDSDVYSDSDNDSYGGLGIMYNLNNMAGNSDHSQLTYSIGIVPTDLTSEGTSVDESLDEANIFSESSVGVISPSQSRKRLTRVGKVNKPDTNTHSAQNNPDSDMDSTFDDCDTFSVSSAGSRSSTFSHSTHDSIYMEDDPQISIIAISIPNTPISAHSPVRTTRSRGGLVSGAINLQALTSTPEVLNMRQKRSLRSNTEVQSREVKEETDTDNKEKTIGKKGKSTTKSTTKKTTQSKKGKEEDPISETTKNSRTKTKSTKTLKPVETDHSDNENTQTQIPASKSKSKKTKTSSVTQSPISSPPRRSARLTPVKEKSNKPEAPVKEKAKKADSGSKQNDEDLTDNKTNNKKGNVKKSSQKTEGKNIKTEKTDKQIDEKNTKKTTAKTTTKTDVKTVKSSEKSVKKSVRKKRVLVTHKKQVIRDISFSIVGVDSSSISGNSVAVSENEQLHKSENMSSQKEDNSDQDDAMDDVEENKLKTEDNEVDLKLFSYWNLHDTFALRKVFSLYFPTSSSADSISVDPSDEKLWTSPLWQPCLSVINDLYSARYNSVLVKYSDADSDGKSTDEGSDDCVVAEAALGLTPLTHPYSIVDCQAALTSWSVAESEDGNTGKRKTKRRKVKAEIEVEKEVEELVKTQRKKDLMKSNTSHSSSSLPPSTACDSAGDEDEESADESVGLVVIGGGRGGKKEEKAAQINQALYSLYHDDERDDDLFHLLHHKPSSTNPSTITTTTSALIPISDSAKMTVDNDSHTQSPLSTESTILPPNNLTSSPTSSPISSPTFSPTSPSISQSTSQSTTSLLNSESLEDLETLETLDNPNSSDLPSTQHLDTLPLNSESFANSSLSNPSSSIPVSRPTVDSDDDDDDDDDVYTMRSRQRTQTSLTSLSTLPSSTFSTGTTGESGFSRYFFDPDSDDELLSNNNSKNNSQKPQSKDKDTVNPSGVRSQFSLDDFDDFPEPFGFSGGFTDSTHSNTASAVQTGVDSVSKPTTDMSDDLLNTDDTPDDSSLANNSNTLPETSTNVLVDKVVASAYMRIQSGVVSALHKTAQQGIKTTQNLRLEALRDINNNTTRTINHRKKKYTAYELRRKETDMKINALQNNILRNRQEEADRERLTKQREKERELLESQLMGLTECLEEAQEMRNDGIDDDDAAAEVEIRLREMNYDL